jgi:ArsR family transcriptional regulator
MPPRLSPHQKISAVLESVSTPARVKILLAIGIGEACVCHLEALLGFRQAYISQQLMSLRESGIISARREGKYIYYRLEKPEALELIRMAARLTGLPDNALVVTEHTACECPRCNE